MQADSRHLPLVVAVVLRRGTLPHPAGGTVLIWSLNETRRRSATVNLKCCQGATFDETRVEIIESSCYQATGDNLITFPSLGLLAKHLLPLCGLYRYQQTPAIAAPIVDRRPQDEAIAPAAVSTQAAVAIDAKSHLCRRRARPAADRQIRSDPLDTPGRFINYWTPLPVRRWLSEFSLAIILAAVSPTGEKDEQKPTIKADPGCIIWSVDNGLRQLSSNVGCVVHCQSEYTTHSRSFVVLNTATAC